MKNNFYYQLNRANFVLLEVVLFLFVLGFLASCASVNKCPENIVEGNISSPVNTSDEELAPFIFDKELFYTTRQPMTNNFKIWIADFKGNIASNVMPVNESTFNSIPNSGLLKIFRLNQTNKTFAYFAGINENSKVINSDIFYNFKNNNDTWTEALPVSNINTEFYDSYPTLSNDGNTIVFASDRPDGIGGIDLYISQKDEFGNWTEPVNLGNEINSDKDEISPFITNDGRLLYSSNGKGGDSGFDIFIANPDGNGFWKQIHKLPPPINSNFDESGAVIYNNQIYLSSNRTGGCGGNDIYSFKHCGDVIIEGSVEGEIPELPLAGKLYLFDSNRELLKVFDVESNGKFKLDVQPSNIYYLQYFNSCVPNYIPEQMIISPCSDTTVVKILVKFILPVNKRKFDFANYKVPFFVSGYYHPNTPKNLESLKLKFAYNLLGNNIKSNYIEKPGEKYEEYALIVQGALDDAVEHITRIFESTDKDCIQKSNTFKIKVSGFADPRTISEFSEYADESIHDKELDFYIEKSEVIDNFKLSQLRAYFTAKYIQSKLKTLLKPNQFMMIKWDIEGLGIDEGDKINELKRRVNIEIGVMD